MTDKLIARLAEAAKALVAAATPILVAAFADLLGIVALEGEQWLTVLAAGAAGGAGVYRVPNRPASTG